MTVEIAKKLVAPYNQALSEIKEDTEYHYAYGVCQKYSVIHGMCILSHQILDELENEEFEVWIDKVEMVYANWYVFMPPRQCTTTPQIIESLQYRKNLLDNFIKENEK